MSKTWFILLIQTHVQLSTKQSETVAGSNKIKSFSALPPRLQTTPRWPQDVVLSEIKTCPRCESSCPRRLLFPQQDKWIFPRLICIDKCIFVFLFPMKPLQWTQFQQTIRLRVIFKWGLIWTIELIEQVQYLILTIENILQLWPCAHPADQNTKIFV